MSAEGHDDNSRRDGEPSGGRDCERAGSSRDVREAPLLADRPINPLAALTLVLVFPGSTFRRLTLRPHWVIPVLFVVLAVLVRRILAVETGLMDDVLQREAFLSGADLGELRGAAILFSVVTAIVSVPLVTLIQTLFLMLFARLLGGAARFASAFSAVAYASVSVGVGALALSALLPVTRSATFGANLAGFLPPESSGFIRNLAMELDLFYVWFFVLVGVAAGPTFGLTKARARYAALMFAVFFVLLMSWIGAGSAGQEGEPLADWKMKETRQALLRFPEETPASTIEEVVRAASLSGARIRPIVGATSERIDCYVYPSLGEKERVTGNASLAHGVT